MNAQEILDECAALYTLPGPPKDFGERTVSDRFEPAAVPTLITNATIWTGNNNGTEVIHGGEIFLEGGLIKYVGDRVPSHFTTNNRVRSINAQLAWVTPAIVDMHSHLGVDSAPNLAGSADTNSMKALIQPWLRSLDGIDTHDESYPLSISGGIATALILPGSADAIGGQAFIIKLRDTKDRTPLSRVLEPPYSLLNGTRVDPTIPPRWRHMKHATGENPSTWYQGTRYNEARKLKLEQDAYCAKAQAHQWTGLPAQIPKNLKWEALVDVLRGRVKVNCHIYETTDFTSMVGLTNEFEFSIAAFHHAHEAYLVPETIKKVWGGVTPGVAVFATNARYKREAYRGTEFAPKILHEHGIPIAVKSDHSILDSRFLLISSKFAALRKALKGGLQGEIGQWYKAVAEGKIPLVVDVAKADHIATLLELKAEVDEYTGKSLRLTLTHATEAHLLAKQIAAAGPDVGVVLRPARQYPTVWDQKRVLPGPPLSAQSSVGVLTDANVTVAIGIEEGWQARNTRFDLAWAALEANGTLSRTEALAMGSSNLETLLGLEPQTDLVAYRGGDVFDLSSRVAAIISPARGFVDLI
ncbi:hypothetical protein DL93DRAFT_2071836 [Clavulina sp. PMI_390]|nr:hypothetical protein DL93DRAFT_2071836 [Clavulina sp. PMI_390]